MKKIKSQFFGTREETAEWLDKHHIKNYTINDDLSVDVNGDADISHQNLTIIPVKFNNITGSFWCSNNNLTSLNGSPKFVKGGFLCDRNKLKSLAGSPESVGGYFSCRDNKLISLVYAPEFVGLDFWCEGNSLLSLLGIINCNFKGKFFFTIDKNKFKQEKLIQTLEKYSYYTNNSIYHFDILYHFTYEKFHSTIKPQLEKEALLQKLNKSEIKQKIKDHFI